MIAFDRYASPDAGTPSEAAADDLEAPGDRRVEAGGHALDDVRLVEQDTPP